MRILQINKYFYPRGGADIHFLDVCKLLEQKGHEIITFSMNHPQNGFSPFSRYFVKYLDLRELPNWGSKLKAAGHILYSTEAARKLEKLIQATTPEVAHLHNIYHQLSPSILPVLKKYRIPVVMTLHDYKLICPNHHLFTQGRVCERCKRHKYYEAAWHFCVFNQFLPSAWAGVETAFHKLWGVYEKNIDLFISPSHFLQAKIREWGIANPSVVVPNFINPEFRSQTTSAKTAGDYLLYFGRLSEEKGLPTLLEAIKQLPEVKLRIVGGGPFAARVNIASRALSNVSVEGYKIGDSLMQEIIGSRAVVIPSAWYENYPVAALEALSYGRPVIAAARGGLLEIVRDRQNGLLFKPDNVSDLVAKIKQLWANPQLAAEWGRAGSEQVAKENNPEAYYQKIMDIYNRLLAGRKL